MLKVGLDFDGTVIQLKQYYTHDLNYELFPNCKEVLFRLSKLGVKFYLNTARTGTRRLLAIAYIHKYNLPIKYTLLNRKVSADVYIDDCNLYCKCINWLEIEKELIYQLSLKQNLVKV